MGLSYNRLTMNKRSKQSRLALQVASLLLMILGIVPTSDTYSDDGQNKLRAFLSEELGDVDELKFDLPNHATFRIRGWKLHLNAKLWNGKPELTKSMIQIMDQQLERVENVIPSESLKKIRKIHLWANPPVPGVRPTAAYHPSARWLKQNHRNLAMAKAIEITNVDKFEFENVRMPYLMLHELAHAYHDQVLGFENPRIRTLFEAASDSGGYDKVKRFTGRKIVDDKAYAMSNPKEYFAESTEAYFGKNDFFPFNQAELKSHDPDMHDLVKKLWGVGNQ